MVSATEAEDLAGGGGLVYGCGVEGVEALLELLFGAGRASDQKVKSGTTKRALRHQTLLRSAT
jgi:hypothetical protein